MAPAARSIGHAGQMARRAAERLSCGRMICAELSSIHSVRVIRRRGLRCGTGLFRASLRWSVISLWCSPMEPHCLYCRSDFAGWDREVSAINAVDLFRGKNVPQGKFRLLVRVTSRAIRQP